MEKLDSAEICTACLQKSVSSAPGILSVPPDSALICIQHVPPHLPQGLPIFVAASGLLGKPLLSLGGLWAQLGPTSFSWFLDLVFSNVTTAFPHPSQ